jgi:hypothetical protein
VAAVIENGNSDIPFVFHRFGLAGGGDFLAVVEGQAGLGFHVGFRKWAKAEF